MERKANDLEEKPVVVSTVKSTIENELRLLSLDKDSCGVIVDYLYGQGHPKVKGANEIASEGMHMFLDRPLTAHRFPKRLLGWTRIRFPAYTKQISFDTDRPCLIVIALERRMCASVSGLPPPIKDAAVGLPLTGVSADVKEGDSNTESESTIDAPESEPGRLIRTGSLVYDNDDNKESNKELTSKPELDRSGSSSGSRSGPISPSSSPPATAVSIVRTTVMTPFGPRFTRQASTAATTGASSLTSRASLSQAPKAAVSDSSSVFPFPLPPSFKPTGESLLMCGENNTSEFCLFQAEIVDPGKWTCQLAAALSKAKYMVQVFLGGLGRLSSRETAMASLCSQIGGVFGRVCDGMLMMKDRNNFIAQKVPNRYHDMVHVRTEWMCTRIQFSCQRPAVVCVGVEEARYAKTPLPEDQGWTRAGDRAIMSQGWGSPVSGFFVMYYKRFTDPAEIDIELPQFDEMKQHGYKSAVKGHAVQVYVGDLHIWDEMEEKRMVKSMSTLSKLLPESVAPLI